MAVPRERAFGLLIPRPYRKSLRYTRAVFRYRIDESQLPLVVFESPGALPPSQIDQDSFYNEVERLLARRVPFATLHDLRGTEPDAARRRRFSSWTQKNFDVLALRLVAHAVVIDSSIQAHILTGVLWMTRSPCPMKVFSNRADAEAWLRSELEARAKRANVPAK